MDGSPRILTKKWKKNNQSQSTATMIVVDDHLELALVSHLDMSLSLIFIPKVIDLNSIPNLEVREELFTLEI